MRDLRFVLLNVYNWFENDFKVPCLVFFILKDFIGGINLMMEIFRKIWILYNSTRYLEWLDLFWQFTFVKAYKAVVFLVILRALLLKLGMAFIILFLTFSVWTTRFLIFILSLLW